MSHTARPKVRSEVLRQQQTHDLLLQLAATRDRGAREALQAELVVLNIPVAQSIAWRFRGRGCALDDLEQTACMALVRAVRDYDPARGHAFLSYAVPCVSGAVRKHFRDFGWTVRPPRAIQELQHRVQAMARTAEVASGGREIPRELAAALGVSEADVREALAARGCFTPASLDLPLAEGDSRTVGDLLVSSDDRATDAVEARIMLGPALALLSLSDRSVLDMRFVEEQSQQQMAERLGTTQPAVSRLITRILGDMHASLTA
jgi:RNA polymerase sigma-B factor